jgi:hypothetical protein
MNAAFKHIWQKWLNFLTNGRIVYIYIMYQSLHDYDHHLSDIRCVLFQFNWLRLWDQESDVRNKFKELNKLV